MRRTQLCILFLLGSVSFCFPIDINEDVTFEQTLEVLEQLLGSSGAMELLEINKRGLNVPLVDPLFKVTKLRELIPHLETYLMVMRDDILMRSQLQTRHNRFAFRRGLIYTLASIVGAILSYGIFDASRPPCG